MSKKINRYTKKELADKHRVKLELLRLMLDPNTGKLSDFSQYLLRMDRSCADRVITFIHTEVVAWMRSNKPIRYIPFRVFMEFNESLPEQHHLGEIINNGFGGDTGMKLAHYMHGNTMILFR